MLRIHNTHGDTIIEVLIALAVLALAFSISYATADRALAVTQNAQEHSLALEYLDSQLEALRYIAGVQGQTTIPASVFTGGGTSFCLTPSPSGGIIYNNAGNPSNPCVEPGNGFDYSVYLTPKGHNVFESYVSWPGLGTLGRQKEDLYYRIYDNQ